jgi:translin
MLEEIKNYLNATTPKLIEKFEYREKLLVTAREVIRYCGEAISLSHRRRREDALKKYNNAIEKIKEINNIIKNFPELLYGDVGTAYQELSEASIVISLIFEEKLPQPTELGIPDVWYILGIADAVGEMRRIVLESLKIGKLNEAEEIYEIMEGIYNELWKIEYPKPLVPNLRQKIDYLRKILEETYHDIFLAKITLNKFHK